jgi:hypothetical protein
MADESLRKYRVITVGGGMEKGYGKNVTLSFYGWGARDRTFIGYKIHSSSVPTLPIQD